MLTHEGAVPARDADCGLETRAAAEDGTGVLRVTETDGGGHVAPGAAEEENIRRGSRDGARKEGRHAVVHAAEDIAVVEEKGVGRAAEAAQGLAVAEADGIACHIARGHDEKGHGTAPLRAGFGEHVEENGVKGRGREHDAHCGGIRRDGRGERRSSAFSENHGGTGRRGEKGRFGFADEGRGPGVAGVRGHEGKGLVRAVLAPAETADRGLIRGVAGELEAAYPPQGDDAAFKEGGGGAGYGIPAVFFRAGGVFRKDAVPAGKEPEMRSAGRAGYGLGVEAPVKRVRVFAGAVRTEGKTGHGRGGAVVGNGARDGVARAAVGAAREGIAVAAVSRVAHVPEAVSADAHIGADKDAVAAVPGAPGYGEAGFVRKKGNFAEGEASEAGEGRKRGREPVPEGRDGAARALNLDAHAF